MRHTRTESGFTLIEIAMVLVVLGLLIGLGAGLVGPMIERSKLIETREIVKSVNESILGYAARYKKLPNSLADLGVRTTDAYNRDLRYYRADSLTASNLCTTTASFLTVNDSSSGNPQTKNNVAFILFGEGSNRTNDTGTASPFTIREQGVNDYDDIALYFDIDKLRSQICTSFRITTETLPLGTEETAYPSTTLEATDGTPTYTWALATGSSLPSGLSLSTSGAISGTPISDGSFNFTVEAKDSDTPNRIATKNLVITINPNKPRIMTEVLAYGTQDQPYTGTLGATGGKPPYTWALAAGSTLPTGLTLSSAGSILGTPTVTGTFSFTVTVTDARGRVASKTLSLAINPSGASSSSCASLSLTPVSGSSFTATVGTSFTRSITVTGGQSPYSNTQCTPASCNGLNMTCAAGGATITGTPTAAGTCTFNVGFKDSCTTPAAQTVSGTYTVTISAPPCSPFTGWNWNLPTVINCQSYTGNTSVLGGTAPFTWSSTPLPNGLLSCSGATGATCNISGTPLASPGTYSLTQTVTDSCTNPTAQTTSQTFTLTVSDVCYSSGISLRNTSRAARYYRRNGGACTTWNKNTNITVAVTNSIAVYSNSTCTTTFCTAPITYCQQKLYDADNNCQTRMNAGCTFADR